MNIAWVFYYFWKQCAGEHLTRQESADVYHKTTGKWDEAPAETHILKPLRSIWWCVPSTRHKASGCLLCAGSSRKNAEGKAPSSASSEEPGSQGCILGFAGLGCVYGNYKTLLSEPRAAWHHRCGWVPINLYLQEQTRGQILFGGHFLSLGLGLERSDDDLPTLACNSGPNIFFSFKKYFMCACMMCVHGCTRHFAYV